MESKSFIYRTETKRMHVKGKFLYAKNRKFYIKGVTYGTFKPDDNDVQFPDAETVEKDFSLMACEGMNAVRTYTVPPKYLLDTAERHQLKVMVGLPWEQHITFLDTKERKKDIVKRVKEGVVFCENHPAILCYTIGNEIPAPIVRWYGKAKIEAFLKSLYKAVKEVDPQGLVTYVNYPTTEYLDLSFLDFDCFNVYLETPEKLSKYISRLHNLSGDRPLVLAEIGLDSMRNGHEKQAEVLKWQIETVFGKGCAGMFVFAWTDEWWRGGFEIEDWDFGLVDRERRPKPALSAVVKAMAKVPFAGIQNFPFISVIVCSYNGSATIRDTMEGLVKLKYPKFEVIVVNDGSKDNLAQIVSEYPVKLINTSNRGLSSARNTGMYNAKGEILAYIDDDAYPDDHWLHYLAYAYNNSTHAAMGGPNIIPSEDGPIATCVANAPGGPVHVLETDEIAEHIPGCNLSVRKDVLMKIGGFDPMYRAAGDDVDVCWRIQEAGYTIGFHPSALVWHHRRNSLKAYWKQQQGYGKAEALLESKWPEKYNGFGHLTWAGRIYGNGFTLPINVKKGKVFHGTWGSALFQSVYQPAEGFLNCIPLMPEWYLLSTLFGVMACLGSLWTPLLALWPVFIASIAVIIIQGIISAVKNTSLSKGQEHNWKYFLLIVLLHIVQPVARLRGRIKNGLTPWRIRGAKASFKNLTLFKSKTLTHWNEVSWKSNETWLEEIEQNIIGLKARVKRGGDFDKWDIKTRNGLFSTAKGVLTVEEHGANKQYVKFRYWSKYSLGGLFLIGVLTAITTFALIDHSWIAGAILCFLTAAIFLKYILDSASVVNCIVTGFTNLAKLDEKESKLNIVHSEKVREEKEQYVGLF
ncbi:glycosyltransferase [Segetibacter aerophilus]|nr:glycosyltransferase [Segetibacter aerophilus]